MKRILQSLFAVAVIAVTAFGQQQAVRSNDSINVQVTRGADVQAGIHVGPNPVTITARHCAPFFQQAEKKAGRKFASLTQSQIGDAVNECNSDSKTVFYSSTRPNLLTNAGKDVIASAVSNTATQAAACNYLGLTNTGITPAAGDTTLSGEIAVNGLSRAQATYAHTGGTSTYTLVKTFTATGAQSAQAAAVFNASSSGSMCFENTFTSVTLANGDTLTVTWTITLSLIRQQLPFLLDAKQEPYFLPTAA